MSQKEKAKPEAEIKIAQPRDPLMALQAHMIMLFGAVAPGIEHRLADDFMSSLSEHIENIVLEKMTEAVGDTV